MRRFLFVLGVFLVATAAICLLAEWSIPVNPDASADWPAWRRDARRSANAGPGLPDRLHLQWVRHCPPLEPAWPDEPRMRFDAAYQPVVAGKILVFGSSHDDTVRALHTDTGAEQWQVRLDGPIRFAPFIWEGRVYVVSDDGYLSCLRLTDGAVLWRVRGGPSDRWVLGNGRLISTWPARGAPVVAEGTVYFAAGIWPFMGVFIHALDARTGAVVWTNSGTGSRWTVQPHRSPAFAGLAPQGYLAAVGDRLLVPNGRAGPACLDRRTGELLYFRIQDHSGNSGIAANERYFANDGQLYDVGDGAIVARSSFFAGGTIVRDGLRDVILDEDMLHSDAGAFRVRSQTSRRGLLRLERVWDLPEVDGRVWIKARRRVYLNDGETLLVVGPPLRGSSRARVWDKIDLGGTPGAVLAADGKLFVATLDGRIACYGGSKVDPRVYAVKRPTRPPAPDLWTRRAQFLIEDSGVSEGYCVALGAGNGRLIEELARQSRLHVVAVEPDVGRVAGARRRLADAGLYGRRAVVHGGDPVTFELPPYLASVVVAEDLDAVTAGHRREFVKRLFRSLRPYGATAYLPATETEAWGLVELVADAGLPGATVGETTSADGARWLTVTRAGSLPGSADWTHQYADPANTVVSRDALVKAPLGLLWFGGSSNRTILPRHGHGPSPQVVGGRLFIEGRDGLRATDVYTGRVLWERTIPGLGRLYDQTGHQAGADATGSNYVSMPDGVYVATGRRCLRLDPVTGETMRTFTLPEGPDGNAPAWWYTAVWEDLLIATAADGDAFWAPDFTPGEFERPAFTPERVAELVRWVRGFEGVRIAERSVHDTDADFLARNLNRCLNEPSLLARLPGRPTDDLRAIQRRIDTHVRSKPRQWRGDITLRGLNRQLLRHANPALPEMVRLPSTSDTRSMSEHLVVMDRHTGRVLWSRTAELGFRHNAVVVGAGKVFCIDRGHPTRRAFLAGSGSAPGRPARLLALDARSGEVVWDVADDVFGTWLGYAETRDLLLEARRPSRDMRDEPGIRMSVRRGRDGSLVWDRQVDYGGPCLLHGDMIVTQGKALDLLTGDETVRTHPLTGQPVPWVFRRNHGCNTAVGGQHLLTFRSAAAGFFDLMRDGGTGNFGGFRSGCTSNLIPANGVLSAPDYTRTCTCSYHNQTSLALVHDPAVEMWTFNPLRRPVGAVIRAGVNFGAPGDRRAEDGTLWLDYPSVGGPSPDIPVKTVPQKPEWFRRHSSSIEGDGLKWVAASGAKGLRKVTLTLDPEAKQERTYTVRLHFTEPDDLKPGERVFDVEIQGRTVLRRFDIATEAGGSHRPVVREFKGVKVRSSLTVTLTPAGAGAPVLCGIEVVAEGW